MKNIGFIAIKNRYTDDYKNITFVFNDIGANFAANLNNIIKLSWR